jgi:hypothetical protein
LIRGRLGTQGAKISIACTQPLPRSTSFGSPLVLSSVHWVEPKLVAEITYLTWTADGPLRQIVYIGNPVPLHDAGNHLGLKQ